MGVLHGRDLLSTKYVTAIIIDSVSGAHFVPIKHDVGDYFFADIKGQLYAFDTRGEQCTYRQTLVKSFKFILYFTDCFKPVSKYYKELELIIAKNGFPLIDRLMLKILEKISKKEKAKFEAVKIKKLIENLEKNKNDSRYAEDYRNMISMLNDLDIDEVVTPVKRVTESLTKDFIVPDPKFMASLRTAFETLDREDKIVNNVPLGSKKAWLKWLAVFALVGLVGTILYMAYDNGAFDDILKLGAGLENIEFPNIGGITAPPSSFTDRYPTPEAAKAALDAGQITESQIPAAMRDLVKNVKVPEVKVELGG